MNSEFGKPYQIAKGYTEPSCGPSQRTKERDNKRKNSHVDWWLYKKAKPYKYFYLIGNFEKYYEDYKNERRGS